MRFDERFKAAVEVLVPQTPRARCSPLTKLERSRVFRGTARHRQVMRQVKAPVEEHHVSSARRHSQSSMRVGTR
jgi:hypothetical protein